MQSARATIQITPDFMICATNMVSMYAMRLTSRHMDSMLACIRHHTYRMIQNGEMHTFRGWHAWSSAIEITPRLSCGPSETRLAVGGLISLWRIGPALMIQHARCTMSRADHGLIAQTSYAPCMLECTHVNTWYEKTYWINDL